jgi:nitrogen-specific signal transduction histidine kinase
MASPTSAAAAPNDRFFRQVVLSMRNGVLAVTRDGTLAVINDEAYRIFNLKRDRYDIGRPYTEVLRAHPDMIRVIAGAFELDHLPNRVEMRLKSGQVIGYTLSRVFGDAGQPAGVTIFFKDLTRVEQLEERERLRDRLAALGEMAAALAHELKNPLAGIEVMAGLLRRQIPASRDSQTILTDIINEAKMANAIVVEMLEFVRPIRLQVERTSIAQVLHDAVTMAESKAKRGETAVSISIAQDLPEIHGDRHQLCQVFTNLLINAFEALEGTGSVSITAMLAQELLVPQDPASAERTLVIDVADDGPGVPEGLTDRIFNAFFTTKPRGSGLGLAIVRRIVDAHDGRIDLYTQTGRGTRFRVMLPITSGNQWFQ